MAILTQITKKLIRPFLLVVGLASHFSGILDRVQRERLRPAAVLHPANTQRCSVKMSTAKLPTIKLSTFKCRHHRFRYVPSLIYLTEGHMSPARGCKNKKVYIISFRLFGTSNILEANIAT
jgi:hypothetical protein